MSYELTVKICTNSDTCDTLEVSLMWEGCGDRPRVQTQVKEETRSEEESI